MAAGGITIDPLYSLQITSGLVADTVSKFRFMDGTSFNEFISQKEKAWMPAGGGAHSVLYQFGKGGVNYFIKHIKTIEDSIPYNVDTVIAEINALIKLRDSPYVVKLLAAQVYQEQAYLLYSWIEGVTLFEWLKKSHTREEKNRVKDALINGLKDIHAAGLLHRDIKTDNIFVPARGDIPTFYLDFGLVVPIDSVARSEGTVAGETENYSIVKQTVNRNTGPLENVLRMIDGSEEKTSRPSSPEFSPYGGARQTRRKRGPGRNHTRVQRKANSRRVRTKLQRGPSRAGRG
jgi:serine/threonine protein kinase